MDAPYATHANNSYNEEDLFLDTATSRIAEKATENWSKSRRTSLQSSDEGQHGGNANITIFYLLIFNFFYLTFAIKSVHTEPK